MVAEGIDQASCAPTIWLIFKGQDNLGSRSQGLLESSVRIVHSQDHSDGAPAQSLGAEVLMLGRFVREPEDGLTHRQFGNHCPCVILDAKLSLGSKCCLVELNCPAPSRTHNIGATVFSSTLD